MQFHRTGTVVRLARTLPTMTRPSSLMPTPPPLSGPDSGMGSGTTFPAKTATGGASGLAELRPTTQPCAVPITRIARLAGVHRHISQATAVRAITANPAATVMAM